MARPARALLAGILSLALAAALPPGAGATPPDEPTKDGRDEARAHFERGEQLYALRRFADALEEYEAAFERLPAPELLFNIGQCHRNLEHHADAIFAFKKYLRLAPAARNRAAVEALIAELEEKQRQAAARRPPPPLPEERPPPRKQPPLRATIPPPAPAEDPPVTSRWWFWTGAVAVVAGGVALGLALTADPGGVPGSDLGNLDFPR